MITQLVILDGGMASWNKEGLELDHIETIDSTQLAEIYQKKPDIAILDVRKPGEWEAEHIKSSQNFPLDFINKHMSEVDKEQAYYMHCRSGYRSTVAASILKSRGFEQVVNVQALFDDMKEKGLPMTQFVCPSTQQ